MEFEERTTEACSNCKKFSPDKPGEKYLQGGDGFCLRKIKYPMRTSLTDWCDRYENIKTNNVHGNGQDSK